MALILTEIGKTRSNRFEREDDDCDLGHILVCDIY